MLLCEGSVSNRGVLNAKAGTQARGLSQNLGLKMGKGAFPAFTLELCPAMLNPLALILSPGHQLAAPNNGVMK